MCKGIMLKAGDTMMEIFALRKLYDLTKIKQKHK